MRCGEAVNKRREEKKKKDGRPGVGENESEFGSMGGWRRESNLCSAV